MLPPHAPTAAPVRRRPPWWAVAIVQLLGAWGAAFCLVVAVFTVPAHGLFGVENDVGTRTGGALATLGFGLGLASGPLLVGLVRRDRRWLAWSLGGAALVALVLLSVLTADGHGGFG